MYPIEKRLDEALEQHAEDASEDDSDAARLSAIRELDEKTARKFAAMETKIGELTDMIQKLVPKDANTAAPGAPATDEASQYPRELN